MTEKENRKKIAADYKERQINGGVYAIKNTKNGKLWVDAAVNLMGSKNRFDFSKQTNLPYCDKIKNDWQTFGSGIFVFEILEEIKINAEQTEAEFKEDLKTLKEIHIARLAKDILY